MRPQTNRRALRGCAPPGPASRSRLGFLTLLDSDPANDDPAGFPNGRRVSDDVTDIAARAVAGIYPETFPFGYGPSGRDSRHIDPGEPGCTGCLPLKR